MRQSVKSQYNKLGEKLVGWVEECDKKKLDPELTATLLLDKAFSLCFQVFGKDKALDALNAMTWEKINEIDDAEERNEGAK